MPPVPRLGTPASLQGMTLPWVPSSVVTEAGHMVTVGTGRCQRRPQQRREDDCWEVVTHSHTRALLPRAGHWNLVSWLLIVFGIGKERNAFCPECPVPPVLH